MSSPLKFSSISKFSSKKDLIRLVQITDCHLGGDKNFILGGVNTYQSLSKILAKIEAKQNASLVVVTGDIACEGEPASYQLFDALMESSGMTYNWLPGNHDDFRVMNQIISKPFMKEVTLGNWVSISLISAVPGDVCGELSDTEFHQLEHLLQKYKDKFVLLFVHHPPVDIHCKWLDEHKISNSDRLGELLAQHGSVKAMFTGHVHQESVAEWYGMSVYSTPSTCFQFTSHSDTFDISELKPGYRWIDLYPNGQIETGVEHLSCDDHKADINCMGY